MTVRRVVCMLGLLVATLARPQGAWAQARTPAETALLNAIAQNPRDIGSYLDLAKLYYETHRYPEAQGTIQNALLLLQQERRGITPSAPQGERAPGAPLEPAPRTLPYLPEGPLRVGGDIKPPTKIWDVAPVYPQDAKAAGVQGLVIIEATIAKDGTVKDLRILKSMPLLDQAAAEAVAQWRYTPPLLQGTPVDIIMTVTVNFSLP